MLLCKKFNEMYGMKNPNKIASTSRHSRQKLGADAHSRMLKTDLA